MADAIVIDGKAIAERFTDRIAGDAAAFRQVAGRKPRLAVVLVGEDRASAVYVRSKGAMAARIGLDSVVLSLSADVAEAELVEVIAMLNLDLDVDGILVQLPLPVHIDDHRIFRLIAPEKDVDGFHPVNVGLLGIGDLGAALLPCTPAGCMHLIRSIVPDPAGMSAVVVGRSNIVGKPVAQLLLLAGCTVTVAHSRTRNLAEVVRGADIVVAAVGRPEFIRGDWIKPGAVVIDVGINRIPAPERGRDATRLVGDVSFAEALAIAGAITPVPGGVGPMTIAMLMANTLIAARRRSEPARHPHLADS